MTDTVIITLEDGTKVELKIDGKKIEQVDNHAPTCFNQNVTTTKNKPVAITLQAQDIDNDKLTYRIVTPPLYGLAYVDATNTAKAGYTPRDDFTGVDVFRFKATDEHGLDSENEGLVAVKIETDQPDTNIVKLVVESVTDDGNDGNPGANAVDGVVDVTSADPNRWSSDKIPATLSMVLKTAQYLKEIHSAKIFFWKETERVEKYSLAFSQDGKTFIETPGINNTTGQVHEIKFSQPIVAKYVKFIGNGNDQNNWTSVLEVELYGKDSTVPVPSCPAGQHWDAAQQKCVPDTPTCPAGQHWDPVQQKCVPDEPQPGGDTPYPVIGTPMSSTTRGPTTRHYASGKPDDYTIEKNTKSIKYKNYQCVVDITNDCDWAHDDTFSIKLGGTHMGTGWFDNSLSVYEGKTGLGTEPEHPSTNLYIIKGPNVGDTRGKRFKYACTYFTDLNKVELWTDFGTGWKKQVEGIDVGGFNPESSEDEFQLRIDGFKTLNDPPTIHSAIVTEIAATPSKAEPAVVAMEGKGTKKVDSDDLDDEDEDDNKPRRRRK